MTLEQILNTEISLQHITQLILGVHPFIWIGIYVVLVAWKAQGILRQKGDKEQFYIGLLFSPIWFPFYLICKIFETPIQKLDDFLDPKGIKLRNDIWTGKKICYKCKKIHRTISARQNLPDDAITDCERTFPSR